MTRTLHTVLILLIVLTMAALAGPINPVLAQDDRGRVVARVESRSVERQQQRRVERNQRQSRETQTERYSKTVTIGANGELLVSNIAGDIVVTRGGGNTATIEVVKIARAETAQEAKAQLSLVEVDIVERGTRAEIKTRYPDMDDVRRGGRRNIDVSVEFNITAPEGTRITVKSIAGDISVRDIHGLLALESVSGSVTIANAGRGRLRTISGNVELTDTRLDGALDAGTVSGSVILRKLTVPSLDVNSISGEVSIEDVACGQVQARSVSGRTSFAGELEHNGRYMFSSHSGEVRLAIAGKTGFNVEATSFSGSVRSDLPVTLRGDTPERRRRERIIGTHGDGGATLELSTFSGSILITKR
jgi:DUF4097 and DUF4098 domain-containing protein YvlB